MNNDSQKSASIRAKKAKANFAAPEPGQRVSPSETNRFLSLKHRDPHHILGAYPADGGIVIRAFRPEAERVEVQIGAKEPVMMAQLHPSGLFSLFIPGLDQIPTYRFRVHYAGDKVFTQRDPYSFLPT